jgi:serine/threonine-protein kinase
VRDVHEREAQLAEANRDLDKALDIGANKLGRHTGRHAGSWVLGPLIGRGAMGEVYAATHEGGLATAAVKTLVATTEPDQLERFRREAEIAKRVRGPGLVEVYDAGALDGEVPYLVMELLHGHDLAWHLRKTRRMELADAVAMCDQIADGLHHAHAAGIVHRDIKPQNLFRDQPEGSATARWKILDFGVSKLEDSGGTLTQNRVIGTPGYMAPEQARGRTADARSDLFALGAVLYRAVTGQPPFRGDDAPQTLFDVVYRGPRRPADLVPDLPRDIDLFLAIALAKQPGDRFASARDFAAGLRAAAEHGLPVDVRKRAVDLLVKLPWGGRLGD